MRANQTISQTRNSSPRSAQQKKLPVRTNLILLTLCLLLLTCIVPLCAKFVALKTELQQAGSGLAQLTEAIKSQDHRYQELMDRAVDAHIRATEYLSRDRATKLLELQAALTIDGISADQKADLESRIASLHQVPVLPPDLSIDGEVTASSPHYCTIELELSNPGLILHRDQFALTQEKKPLHHVTLFELEKKSASRSVYVLVDQSGSTKEVMPEVKRAMAGFVQSIAEVANVKLAAFNDSLQPLTQWTSNGAELQAAVQQLRADGGTALRDSLLAGIQELSTKSTHKTLILLSDGRDSKDNADFETVTKAAHVAGVEITTIAINTPQDHTEVLRSLGTKTGGLSFSLKNVSELKNHFESIARKLRTKRWRFVVLDPLNESIPITIEANNGKQLKLKLPNRERS